MSTKPPVNTPDEPNDDELFRELLSPLRSLHPSEASQQENRRIANGTQHESSPAVTPQVTVSSATTQTGPQTGPRFAASSLIALACTLLMGVGIGWGLRGPLVSTPSAEGSTKSVNSSNEEPVSPQLATPPNTAEQMVATSTSRTPIYHTSETYLFGFGTVSTSSGYYYPEN